jgi:hypothetical protein
MRIIRFLSLSLFFLPCFSFAQEPVQEKVPQSILNKFDSIFPEARNTTWKVVNYPKGYPEPFWYFQPYTATFRYTYLSNLLPKNYRVTGTRWTKNGLDEIKLLYDSSRSARLAANGATYYVVKRPAFTHCVADSEAVCHVGFDNAGNIKITQISIKDSLIKYSLVIDASHSIRTTVFSIDSLELWPTTKVFTPTRVYAAFFDSAESPYYPYNKYAYADIYLNDSAQVSQKMWGYIKKHYPAKCQFNYAMLRLSKEGISIIDVALVRKKRWAWVRFDHNSVLIDRGRFKDYRFNPISTIIQ